MIQVAKFVAVFTAILGLLALLPAYTFPSYMHSFIQNMNSHLWDSGIDRILPLSIALELMTTSILFLMAFGTWKMIKLIADWLSRP